MLGDLGPRGAAQEVFVLLPLLLLPVLAVVLVVVLIVLLAVVLHLITPAHS